MREASIVTIHKCNGQTYYNNYTTFSFAYSVLEPLLSRTCLKHHLRGLLHQLATFKDQNELNQQFLMLLFSGFVAMCSKTAVNGRR